MTTTKPCLCSRNPLMPASTGIHAHDRACPARLEVFGGNRYWSQAHDHLVDDKRWIFDKKDFTWRPHPRWYIFFQVVKIKGRHLVSSDGFIPSPTAMEVDHDLLVDRLEEMGYRVVKLSQFTNMLDYSTACGTARFICHAHITENNRSGHCIPDTPVFKVYLN